MLDFGNRTVDVRKTIQPKDHLMSATSGDWECTHPVFLARPQGRFCYPPLSTGQTRDRAVERSRERAIERGRVIRVIERTNEQASERESKRAIEQFSESSSNRARGRSKQEYPGWSKREARGGCAGGESHTKRDRFRKYGGIVMVKRDVQTHPNEFIDRSCLAVARMTRCIC